MGLPELFRSWADYHRHLLEQVRVLIVDDVPEDCQVLEEILLDEGFQVDSVASAEAAWMRLETVSYDLVVAAAQLAGGSGLRLLERIRDSDLNIPSVLITERGSPVSVSEALHSGAHDYIVKPFGNRTLVRTRLRRVIDRRISILLYTLVVEELKKTLARGELDADAQEGLRSALFAHKDQLSHRLQIMLVGAGSDVQEAAQRTLNAAGLSTETGRHGQDLMDRIEQVDGPLVALLEVDRLDHNFVDKIRQADPYLELIAFSDQSVPFETLVRALEDGADDFIVLGQEGLIVLKARARHAAERGRRRRLHVHLAATLYHLAQEGGQSDWDELLSLMPREDQSTIRGWSPPRVARPSSEPKRSIHEVLSELGAPPPGAERRLHERVEDDRPIWIVYTDVDSISDAYARRARAGNISRGGMLVYGEPPPLGSILMVLVPSEGQGYHAVVGRVVRHEVDQIPQCFGLEFLRADEEITTILGGASSGAQ